ncbi:MAG: hypothetical protein ACK5QH_09005 [Rubrivivax sp.]
MSDFIEALAMFALYLVACLGVVAAVVCRINEMNSKRNKLSWFIMYLSYAVYALAVLFELLTGQDVDPVHLLGLAALGLNLFTTIKSWAGGRTPRLSCKPGCEP